VQLLVSEIFHIHFAPFCNNIQSGAICRPADGRWVRQFVTTGDSQPAFSWPDICRLFNIRNSDLEVDNTMKTFSNKRSLWITAGLAACLSLGSLLAMAHGDVVPQSVDTHTLPQLGDKWLENNPYSSGEAHKEALRIGSSAYNQNCARCHGLEAISGGISPDLRKLDNDCMSLGSDEKKLACFQEINDYFVSTVRRGRTRDGRVYMPPFEGILTQEAMWSIKTYLETRREP
jgi:cytochrome c-550 PedF